MPYIRIAAVSLSLLGLVAQAHAGGGAKGRSVYRYGGGLYGGHNKVGRLYLPRALSGRGALTLDGARFVVHRAKVGKRSKPLDLQYDGGTAYYGNPLYFKGGLRGLVEHLDQQKHPVTTIAGVRQGEVIAVRSGPRSRVYVLAPDGQVIDKHERRSNAGAVERSPLALFDDVAGTQSSQRHGKGQHWELLKVAKDLKPGRYQIVVAETGVKPPRGGRSHANWGRFRRYTFVVPKPGAKHGAGLALARERLEHKGLVPSAPPQHERTIERWYVDHRGWGMNHKVGTVRVFSPAGGKGRATVYRKKARDIFARYRKVQPVRLVGKGYATLEAARAGKVQTIKVGISDYIDLPGTIRASTAKLDEYLVGGYQLGSKVKRGDRVFVDLAVKDDKGGERFHRVKLVVR